MKRPPPAFLRDLWCWLAHRRFITWRGSGDWLVYRCSKCAMAWPEHRRGGAPRGTQEAQR